MSWTLHIFMLPSDNRSIFRLSWWLSSKPVRWADSTPIHAALVFCGSQSRHPKISHSTAVLHIRVTQIWYLILRARNSAGIARQPEAMGYTIKRMSAVKNTVSLRLSNRSIFRLSSFLFLTQRDCSTIRKTVQRIMFPAAWFCGRLEYRRIKFTITLTTTGTTRCLETIFPGMLMGLVQTISLMATEHIGGLYLGRRSLPSYRIKVRFSA